MDAQKYKCKVCGGSGLLMDNEQWEYTCSICHGDRFIASFETAERLQVDENHRIIEKL